MRKEILERREKKKKLHAAFQETFKCRGNSKERYQERKYNYHYTVRTILVIVFFPMLAMGHTTWCVY